MGENNLQPVDAAGSKWVIQRSASGLRLESHHKARAISEEIQKLTQKGARQEVNEDEEGFYSRLFLVPKDGQMRLVNNLWPLNQFLFHNHFKMEGIHVVRDLQKNDWMTRMHIS